MMPGPIENRGRRVLVPIVFALLLAVTAGLFWRPLLAWFTGGSTAGRAKPAEEAPAAAVKPADRAATDAAGAEAPAIPPFELPGPALAAVQNALAAYEVVRAHLAQDRIEGVATPAHLVAEQLRAASSELGGEAPLAADALAAGATAADRVAAATTLADARRWFGDMTRFVVSLAMSDQRLRADRHLFSCPMTDGGYSKWLQTSHELENPYMGTSMPTCGSEATWTAGAPAAAAGPTGSVSHEGHGHRGADVAHYTCGMHPWVRQKKPGACPVCAMELSPVTYDETESGIVRVDEERRKRIGVKTARVAHAPMSVAIRAVGRLTYDETRLKDVTLKVKGWIATLRVNATGQPVRKGETLFALYSPELYAAQQEYLLALDSQRAAGSAGMAPRGDYLVKAAEKKLRLWDMTSAQLATLAARSEPMEEIPILAPASGYIIEKDVVEGAAVEPGQRLYRIASLDRVWVEAQVYELDLGKVRKGQKASVTLPYQAGEALTGTVAYVYPYLDPTSRTGRVRIELPNKDLTFKPDMYANVELRIDLGERLQVPVDAVVYTGPRRLVFMDLGEGRLRPQEVELGARNAETVEIRSGLRAGDVVVTSANFLIAAESRIRSAAAFWSDEVTGDRPGAAAGADHAGP